LFRFACTASIMSPVISIALFVRAMYYRPSPMRLRI